MGNNIKKLTLSGLMIAIVFVTTCFTRIPGPVAQGYINFGDIFIMAAAIIIGKNIGCIAGAFGSALADIAVGGFLFAPVTFIVKGLEGYVTGAIAGSSGDNKQVNNVKIMAAVCVGALVMVAGYFLSEMYILKIFSDTFGYTAAITELPANLLQGGVSAAAGYIIVGLLNKVNIRKYIYR